MHSNVFQQVKALVGDNVFVVNIHDVRDVSPRKHMLCVSFKLGAQSSTEQAPCKRKPEPTEISEPEPKRARHVVS